MHTQKINAISPRAWHCCKARARQNWWRGGQRQAYRRSHSQRIPKQHDNLLKQKFNYSVACASSRRRAWQIWTSSPQLDFDRLTALRSVGPKSVLYGTDELHGSIWSKHISVRITNVNINHATSEQQQNLVKEDRSITSLMGKATRRP